MKDDDMELSIKIVIVGNGVVGKSSMIQRFCRGIFTNQYKKTLGVDFMERIVRVKSENIRLMLWDTAGQEEFDAITKAYYRGANACLIVFSTTDRDSFLSIEKWKKKVEFECGEIPTAVVQNKIDLSNESVVERHEIENITKRFKWKLFRTSVKDNINVENVFHFLAESYVDSLDDYNEESVSSSQLSLFPNNSTNIRTSNADKPFERSIESIFKFLTKLSFVKKQKIDYSFDCITIDPLFNKNVGHFSFKYGLPSNKMGFRYINNGIGLHSLTNNPVLSHYGYKNRSRGRPVCQESSGILLHRHHYQNLLQKNSLKHNFLYSNSYNSDNVYKNSFFKSCRIF